MAPPRPRRRQTHDGQVEQLRVRIDFCLSLSEWTANVILVEQDMLLWNYLERRDDRSWMLSLDLDDIFEVWPSEMGALFTDDEDDDDDNELVVTLHPPRNNSSNSSSNTSSSAAQAINLRRDAHSPSATAAGAADHHSRPSSGPNNNQYEF